MNIHTKIELLKFVKHFIIKKKTKIAIIFLKQLLNKATNKRELIMLNGMVECLESNNAIFNELVIERIDEIIKNEKNYPIFASMDNSNKMILG